MEKLIILGTSNDGFRHYYEIKKEDSVRNALVYLMKELGFDEGNFRYLLDGKDCNDCRPYYNFSEINDEHESFNNKDFDVDLFIGEEKVLLSIRTKKRDKLLAAIDKNSEFIKIKPIKGMINRKEYKKLWKNGKNKRSRKNRR